MLLSENPSIEQLAPTAATVSDSNNDYTDPSTSSSSRPVEEGDVKQTPVYTNLNEPEVEFPNPDIGEEDEPGENEVGAVLDEDVLPESDAEASLGGDSASGDVDEEATQPTKKDVKRLKCVCDKCNVVIAGMTVKEDQVQSAIQAGVVLAETSEVKWVAVEQFEAMKVFSNRNWWK